MGAAPARSEETDIQVTIATLMETLGVLVASDEAHTVQILARTINLAASIADGETVAATCLREEVLELHRVCEARRRDQAAKVAQLRSRITDLAERLSAVVQRSRQDGLTGLASRAAWEERLLGLPGELAQGAGLALALLDVDHFKRINDDYGHAAGDRALRTLATLCAQAFGSDDFIARYGGDEIAVLIVAPTPAHAIACCERLLAAARRVTGRRRRTDDPPPFTLSIGLALAQAAEPTAGLLARADAALYAAKHAGRDQVVVSPPATSVERRAVRPRAVSASGQL